MYCTTAVQIHIFGGHISSGAYENNVKWTYSSAPGHIADGSRFI